MEEGEKVAVTYLEGDYICTSSRCSECMITNKVYTFVSGRTRREDGDMTLKYDSLENWNGRYPDMQLVPYEYTPEEEFWRRVLYGK